MTSTNFMNKDGDCNFWGKKKKLQKLILRSRAPTAVNGRSTK